MFVLSIARICTHTRAHTHIHNLTCQIFCVLTKRRSASLEAKVVVVMIAVLSGLSGGGGCNNISGCKNSSCRNFIFRIIETVILTVIGAILRVEAAETVVIQGLVEVIGGKLSLFI